MKTPDLKICQIALFLCFYAQIYTQPEKVVVEGAIVLGNTNPGSPENGTIRFNSITNDFEGYNGTRWISLTRVPDGITGMTYDIEGNSYRTVIIGNQEWMAQNLRTIHYNNGTLIPKVTDNTAWKDLSTPGLCWYNNDSTNYADPYGALYNYYAVANTNNLNVCPVGWHIPSLVEWTDLAGYLGGDSPAGGKMKEPGGAHWNDANVGATNESGFTGLPGAYRSPTNGTFLALTGNEGYYWSGTESGSTTAYLRKLFYFTTELQNLSDLKKLGLSVRCLRDD